MSKIEQTIEEWKELEPKKKIMLGAVALAGVIFIAVHHFVANSDKPPESQEASAEVPVNEPIAAMPGTFDSTKNRMVVMPQTNRNQGLEDMNTRLNQMEETLRKTQAELTTAKNKKTLDYEFQEPHSAAAGPASKSTTTGAGTGATATVNLDQPLGTPQKVDFNEKASGKGMPPSGMDVVTPPSPPLPPEMKVWESSGKTSQLKAKEVSPPSIMIPVNSALEGVMLSGINARQPGSSTGAAGSATSALNVGAPFVTKLKGNAILPNGWKLSQLGDCLMGGSAVAILSTERANAIADTISCIAPNGEVWESPVKAYALDVDGTLGIAGKVVSKQGSILMQSALAAMVSGLGTAIAPTAIPSYNSNASSGQQQSYQLPNPSYLLGSSVGQGFSSAATLLSKFYLDYAREIFPVVEVASSTRVTWILKESIELKKTSPKKGANK
jgi:conjugal transfer pilus assembly protein TraB